MWCCCGFHSVWQEDGRVPSTDGPDWSFLQAHACLIGFVSIAIFLLTRCGVTGVFIIVVKLSDIHAQCRHYERGAQERAKSTLTHAESKLTCWSTPTASRPVYIMFTQPSLDASTNNDISAFNHTSRHPVHTHTRIHTHHSLLTNSTD